MVVFCNDRQVADAAWASRRQVGLENFTVVVLEETYPLSHLSAEVERLLLVHGAPSGKESYPEWSNRDYILLQFSKFRYFFGEHVLCSECLFYWLGMSNPPLVELYLVQSVHSEFYSLHSSKQ